ncbi:MAG: hypothetical protein ACLSHC_14780 [Bilophila wadsworthia]
MIAFRLNGQATTYDGDPAVSLLPISAMTATSRRPRTAAPVRRPAEPALWN